MEPVEPATPSPDIAPPEGFAWTARAGPKVAVSIQPVTIDVIAAYLTPGKEEVQFEAIPIVEGLTFTLIAPKQQVRHR